MHHTTRLTLTTAWWFGASLALPAQSLHDVGLLPNMTTSRAVDVNDDGTVVLVTTQNVFPNSPPWRSRAALWTLAGGLQEIPVVYSSSDAAAGRISPYGNFVSGVSGPFNGSYGYATFVWDPYLGVRELLPGGIHPLEIQGLSADGSSLAIGWYGNHQGIYTNHAVYATHTSYEVLPPLFANSGSFVTDISAAGDIVVGHSSQNAVRWTRVQGVWTVQYLGSVHAGASTYAEAISGDGSTIVGDDVLSNRRVFRWTSSGIQGLGTITGITSVSAVDVNQDGSRIVANGTGSLGDRAMFWRTGIGWVDLTAYVAGLNVGLGTRTLPFVYGLSGDGNTLVGVDSLGHGFVLHLGPSPTPSAAQASAYGAGCGGPAVMPSLAADAGSLPWLGGSFGMRVDNLGNPSLAVLAAGASSLQWAGQALPLDLSAVGLTGCSLLASPDAAAALVGQSGQAVYPLALPAVPSLVGLNLFAQAAAFRAGTNPAGIVLSNGLHLQLGWY